MSNKNLWLLVILLLILTALVVLVGRDLRHAGAPTPVATTTVPSTIPENPNTGAVTSTSQFAAPAPAPGSIKVPTVGEVLPAAQQKVVAVPTVVVPAGPGMATTTGPQLRIYNIAAAAGHFVPYQIIANVGDTVHINFTAEDGAYDITFPSYGMKQTAQKGQTKILEFQALEAGTFTFYCTACGGPTSTARGQIIIAK